MACRDLRTQGIKELFHLCSSLALSNLMAIAKRWRAAIWRIRFWGIGFACEIANLLVLKRVMMGARHGIWNYRN